MEKKAGAKKKKFSKRKRHSVKKEINHTPTYKEIRVEKTLTENFIALQKVMTNLSIKFDNLSTQISKLLELFEISAKTLTKKDFQSEKSGKENKEILEKLDTLAGQNKVIARGLTLIHEVNQPETNAAPQNPPQNIPPMPNQSPPSVQETPDVSTGGYQRSISSSPPRKFTRLPRS